MYWDGKAGCMVCSVGISDATLVFYEGVTDTDSTGL